MVVTHLLDSDGLPEGGLAFVKTDSEKYQKFSLFFYLPGYRFFD